jgi:hypothetical protein
MVGITYTLRGSNGEQITFDQTNFVLNPGMTGFGVAPTQVRIDPSSGIGGVFRHSRRATRELDLPITVLGTNQLDVQTKLRKLARITQDRRGPMRLRATYSTGQQLFMDLHYVGGAEGQWGEDQGGATYAVLVLSCQAPKPFWESLSKQQFNLTGGGAGRGLLPQLTKLKISSSQALGDVTINSTADVEIYPVWTIKGPVEDFTVDDGKQSWSITGVIALGETYTVDTELKTVVDQDGVNRYDRLGPAPKLFPFQPGETTLAITGTNTTDDTSVTAEYALRFEVVH